MQRHLLQLRIFGAHSMQIWPLKRELFRQSLPSCTMQKYYLQPPKQQHRLFWQRPITLFPVLHYLTWHSVTLCQDRILLSDSNLVFYWELITEVGFSISPRILGPSLSKLSRVEFVKVSVSLMIRLPQLSHKLTPPGFYSLQWKQVFGGAASYDFVVTVLGLETLLIYVRERIGSTSMSMDLLRLARSLLLSVVYVSCVFSRADLSSDSVISF